MLLQRAVFGNPVLFGDFVEFRDSETLEVGQVEVAFLDPLVLGVRGFRADGFLVLQDVHGLGRFVLDRRRRVPVRPYLVLFHSDVRLNLDRFRDQLLFFRRFSPRFSLLCRFGLGHRDSFFRIPRILLCHFDPRDRTSMDLPARNEGRIHHAADESHLLVGVLGVCVSTLLP